MQDGVTDDRYVPEAQDPAFQTSMAYGRRMGIVVQQHLEENLLPT